CRGDLVPLVCEVGWFPDGSFGRCRQRTGLAVTLELGIEKNVGGETAVRRSAELDLLGEVGFRCDASTAGHLVERRDRIVHIAAGVLLAEDRLGVEAPQP